MALDLPAFEAALKTHYTTDRVENLVYSNRPLLALLPKMEDFGGDGMKLPITIGDPAGISDDFGTAQSYAASGVVNKAFQLVRSRAHAIGTIDSELIEASRGDKNAFMEAMSATIDGLINGLSNKLAREIYRTGYGDVGVVGSISGSTITLASPDDVVNFGIGQPIVFSDTLSSSVLRDSGDELVVTGIDRTNGILTFAEAVSTVSGLIVGDIMFVKGNRESSSTPTRRVAGLGAWLPSTAPSPSESFFGVDRSTDSRLSGVLHKPLAGTSMIQILQKAASLVGREGGALTHFFMNDARWNDLALEIGTKREYVDVDATASIGFKALEVNGPRGVIKCLADHNCPAGDIFGLSMPYWKLYSLGKAVRVNDSDGNKMLRMTDADAVELRYVFSGNVACRAPGWNVRIVMS